MGKFSQDQFEVTQYLGNKVGRKNKFMRSIACMDPEWREIRACTEIIRAIDETLTKKELEDLTKIDKVAEFYGRALWKMDIISHLSMFLGSDYKQHDATL